MSSVWHGTGPGDYVSLKAIIERANVVGAATWGDDHSDETATAEIETDDTGRATARWHSVAYAWGGLFGDIYLSSALAFGVVLRPLTQATRLVTH